MGGLAILQNNNSLTVSILSTTPCAIAGGFSKSAASGRVNCLNARLPWQ